MSTDQLLLVGGFALQLIAMLLAVARIISHSARQMTDMEVRAATRFTRLETKTERIELDVQNLFRVTSKRIADHT